MSESLAVLGYLISSHMPCLKLVVGNVHPILSHNSTCVNIRCYSIPKSCPIGSEVSLGIDYLGPSGLEPEGPKAPGTKGLSP